MSGDEDKPAQAEAANGPSTGVESSPPRKRRGARRVLLNICHLVALAALLLTVDAAVVSEKMQPFYGWIQDTSVEHVGAYVVGVVNRLDMACRRFAFRLPLFSEEARARENLRLRIEESRPTHLVVTTDRRCVFGRIAAAEQARWEIVPMQADESFPSVLRPEDISHAHAIQYPPIQLFAQDVRFLVGFPAHKPYLLYPYLIVAEVPFDQVYAAWGVLSRLREEFAKTFGPVFVNYPEGAAYVCLFGSEEEYLRRAIEREDVDLERSIGFYSQTEDCLYVYDRTQSFARKSMEQDLVRVAELARAGTSGRDEEVDSFVAGLRSAALADLKSDVVNTLRHEGTHQLAYRHGVHSAEAFEHLWVIEGLAQYCETTPFGETIAPRLALLRKAAADGELIPWQDLVDAPARTGFGTLDERVGLAYAQSWLLVRVLMRPANREGFFNYIRKVQTMAPADLGMARSMLLERETGRPFLEIVQAVRAEL